jgi:hypothetical protein
MMLGKVLNQFYDGRWETSPVPTDTIDDYEGINWVGTPPSKSEVKAKLSELQATYDAQEYARSRKEEYDVLKQFEMQFDDEINSTTTWKDAIIAIKAKYPKPE